MKKSTKKLVLAKETLRELGDEQTEKIAAGAGIFSTGVSRCARDLLLD
jgi:hypothetical protein